MNFLHLTRRVNPRRFRQLGVRQLVFFCFSYIALQIAFSCGASLQRHFNLERGMLAVENRISLDLAHLSLPNPNLNMAGNAQQVKNYLQQLNAVIAEQDLPLRISSLQSVAADNSPVNGAVVIRQLRAPEQTVELGLTIQEPSLLQGFSLYPLLLSAILLLLIRPYLKHKTLSAGTSATPVAVANLLLDLHKKELALTAHGARVPLANKPLCFYAALLTYCQRHPDARLSQHQQLPNELLELADKYFLRLIDLGHTIRKRPDFNANLEKMLSEIRAALDELFSDTPTLKPLYYPPKATGEGSRSKMHNFALRQLQDNAWAINGK